MRIEICETNYSASPVGDNTWDLMITTYGQTQIVPNQATPGDALNYLVSLYPDSNLEVSITSLKDSGVQL